MLFKNRSHKEPTDQTVMITRTFNATPETVFKEWTDPDRLKRWWGPRGFSTPLVNIDLRPGGIFHNCMRSTEGKDYCSKGVYREIIPSERIVCSDYFVDEKGQPVSAAYYGMSATWPMETLVTVTFTEDHGKTKLTLKHEVGNVPETEMKMCEQGWSESLDKLADDLKAK
jgi:uncharacterized protein YndB with AHSA1/START domain